MFRQFAAVALFAALLTVSAQAQQRAAGAAATPAAPAAAGPLPDAKIAFINTEAFGDEKEGIRRFTTALKSLENEFKPRQTELEGMRTRLRTIADDINKISNSPAADPNSVRAKQEEGERLQTDIKRKSEDAEKAFQRRYSEVVGPISADIGKALDRFAQTRGITMMLDISKLLPAVLTVSPGMDMTRAFIAEYNSSNPATAAR